MIQIQRPENGPSSLINSGARQTKLDCEAYDRGVRKFPDRKYYSRPPVKRKLLEIHHNKCCFCETKYPESTDLDVEHFRPKGACRQNRAQIEDEQPGYYWLAYRWDNLLISCTTCNRLNKRVYFPLKNITDRARSHHMDVNLEHPFLIDPAKQLPREHIRFSDDTPVGITSEGKVTILRLGLRRPGLTGDRRDHLDIISKSYQILKLAERYDHISDFQELAEKVRENLKAGMQPEAKFSSMVIDFIKYNPL